MGASQGYDDSFFIGFATWYVGHFTFSMHSWLQCSKHHAAILAMHTGEIIIPYTTLLASLTFQTYLHRPCPNLITEFFSCLV